MAGGVTIAVGPIPAESVRTWVRNARAFVHALLELDRSHGVDLPGDVTEAFFSYLDKWEQLANGTDEFRWTETLDPLLVRRLSAYWVHLAEVATHRTEELDLPVGEPGGEAFSQALLDAVAIGLQPAEDGERFSEKIREAWPDGEAPAADRPRVRVLLVDDADDIRLLMRIALDQDRRFEVVGESSNGQEAVDYVEANGCPEVVLLDLAMPVMDGRAALPLLKRHCPGVSIVMLTAHADLAERELLDLGAARVLRKETPLKQVAETLYTSALSV